MVKQLHGLNMAWTCLNHLDAFPTLLERHILIPRAHVLYCRRWRNQTPQQTGVNWAIQNPAQIETNMNSTHNIYKPNIWQTYNGHIPNPKIYHQHPPAWVPLDQVWNPQALRAQSSPMSTKLPASKLCWKKMKTKERMAETVRHPIFIDFVGSHFAKKSSCHVMDPLKIPTSVLNVKFLKGLV